MEYSIYLTFVMAILHLCRLSTSTELNMNVFGDRGEIASPNYPQKYPLNLTCVWTLTASKDHRIEINFVDFQLEQVKKCIYDYVQVRGNQSKAWSEFPKFCGRNYPRIIKSTGSSIQIKFYSDRYDIVDRGFKLQWTAKPVKPATAPTAKIVPCPTKSIIKTITVCPTPRENCNCAGVVPTISKGDGGDGTSGGSKCDNSLGSGCESHPVKGSEDKTDTVVVAAFSTLLVLFILVCAVLVIMLWRRTRELEYLKTPPKSPDFQWIPGHRFPSQNFETQNRAHEGSLVRQITNASKICDNQDCTLCSLNRHLNRYTGNSYDRTAKSSVPHAKDVCSSRFPVLLSVTEDRHSVASDGNSIAESETSDAYISSCLQSPADTFGREPEPGFYPAKCAV